jgi:hypothetical protein
MLLDYIMHNDDMQVLRNLAHLVHNPRRDHVHYAHSMSPRRDYNRCSMCSRDRSRRT